MIGPAIETVFEIFLRANFILATGHARYTLPEVHVGIAPDWNVR